MLWRQKGSAQGAFMHSQWSQDGEKSSVHQYRVGCGKTEKNSPAPTPPSQKKGQGTAEVASVVSALAHCSLAPGQKDQDWQTGSREKGTCPDQATP